MIVKKGLQQNNLPLLFFPRDSNKSVQVTVWKSYKVYTLIEIQFKCLCFKKA